MPKIKKTVLSKKPKLAVKKRAVLGAKKIGKKIPDKKLSKSISEKKETFSKVSFPIVSPEGEKTGVMSLPNDLFGVPFNAQLVSQAIRVYQMNQREGSAATKTRGMVEGSTRKIYRQKGTGRARHGGIRAPTFVGGGISFGPQPREIHKALSKQMKKKALANALSHIVQNNAMKVVDGLMDLPVKTKSFADMLNKIQVSNRILFIYGNETASVARALRNIKNVSVFPVDSFSAYDVMTHTYTVFTKDALVSLIDKRGRN